MPSAATDDPSLGVDATIAPVMWKRGRRALGPAVVYGRVVVALLVLGACTGGATAGSSRSTDTLVATAGARDQARLVGAGSSASAPVVEEWLRLYRAAARGVSTDYSPEGTAAAIRRLLAGSVDFALLDGPLSPAERQAAGGPDGVVQVPVAGGAVAVTYNLPGVEVVNLSARNLAGIFDGSITRWNDPALQRDNPLTSLPATRISAVHRSDPSATTLVFTEHLRAAAPAQWTVGAGREVRWPAGRGAAGSAALIAAVQGTEGAVGYAGLAVARQAGLAVAAVTNASGERVAPSVRSVEAAMGRAVGNEQDLTLMVPHDVPAPAAYPMVMVTNLVFRTDLDERRGQALRNFAAWVLTEGQRSAERVGFAPLPLPLLVRTLEGVQQGGIRPQR